MSKDGLLPPGVTENMIPGDRPEDIEYREWVDEHIEEVARDFIGEYEDFLIDMDNGWKL